MTVNPESTVAELATANFARVRVFERFSIDYCCGGNVSLTEACLKKGVDSALVQDLLVAADKEPQRCMDWKGRPLSELTGYITETYHVPLRAELPRLNDLFAHVSQKHGSDHPELREAVPLFERLGQLLLSHLAEEEAVFFPLCAHADEVGTLVVADPSLLAMLREEHQEVGLELARLRELLGNYEAPEGACRKFQALLAGLSQFEREMHEHVHLENNVLFGRMRELLPA